MKWPVVGRAARGCEPDSVRAAVDVLFFEHLFKEPLLSRSSNEVFRQLTDLLISGGCLERQLADHGRCEWQLSPLFAAAVLEASAEPRGVGCRVPGPGLPLSMAAVPFRFSISVFAG
jgi:hypothetical protein